MASKPNVLLVEDSPSMSRIYQEYLKQEPIKLETVDTGQAAKEQIKTNLPGLVLLDLNLPDMNGMDILQWIHKEGYPCAVIIITGNGSVDIAVDAMRFGAYDFLEKPFEAKRLKITVRNALERHRLQNVVEDIETTFERKSYHDFIGSSLPMQTVYRIIDAAAPSKATVFITGESGTGKEVCAEAIHKQGPRKGEPFIPINCGAIPRDLMESEIFGHVKGAFTGASKDREGAAARADGGTLFLDEIGEMDIDLQTKLLRFVQTGRYQRVGGSREEQVDVRFICATNRDPLEDVANGRFREDLYYRLHVVPLQLPPLRDRGGDIVDIATHFLCEYATEEGKEFHEFSPDVEVILRKYTWPGNVRQLQNVIRNIVVLHGGKVVTHTHLPPPLDTALSDQELQNEVAMLSTPEPESATNDNPSIIPLWQVEKAAIEQAIEICGGNIPKASALLEVSPSTIYRKKQAWEEE
ncbi:MAG: sigma-54-dependent Fis family transcriptional regulator [Bacteroidetes bacterium]|nr:sigma-54-dependent Fis family transcriptional regulator [Bacteroidota bacterium]